jgi:hypothetical protein
MDFGIITAGWRVGWGAFEPTLDGTLGSNAPYSSASPLLAQCLDSGKLKATEELQRGAAPG